MTTLLTPELIEKCHAGSKAKGFWDVIPPQGQQLMLIISELAESLEAHRKGKRTMAGCVEGAVNTLANCPEYFETRFVANIKDTVEDELADAYIRLCDYAGGFEFDLPWLFKKWADAPLPATNYAEALLGITALLTQMQDNCDPEWMAALVFAGIEALAASENIDLAAHIDLKLRYNQSRPDRHGKAY